MLPDLFIPIFAKLFLACPSSFTILIVVLVDFAIVVGMLVVVVVATVLATVVVVPELFKATVVDVPGAVVVVVV